MSEEPLRSRNWLALAVFAAFTLPGTAAFADKHDHDHGHDRDDGHWRDKRRDHDDDDDRRGYGFADHDRVEIRDWYAGHHRHLPPGLAKKYYLPPAMENQLVIRAAFPVALEAQVAPVPVDLDRQLPPPPPDCERVVVGGHIVLRNRNTKIVLDIFHFE
jgi:Ni/Co efflux regulator RcnB